MTDNVGLLQVDRDTTQNDNDDENVATGAGKDRSVIRYIVIPKHTKTI